MRLIDADVIDFGEVFIGQSDFAKDTREAAQSLIDAQPTVYDMDKVVGLLEQEKADLTTWGEDMAYGLAIEKAIKVVKEGGVNE